MKSRTRKFSEGGTASSESIAGLRKQLERKDLSPTEIIYLLGKIKEKEYEEFTSPPKSTGNGYKRGGSVKKPKEQTVMGEFKRGSLKSSSGKKVTNRKQAVAIALSEARSKSKRKK